MNREEFLSEVSRYYEEFESLKTEPSFYDYEKSFVEIWQRLGREYMEKQLNETSVRGSHRHDGVSVYAE
ncbi:MAG: hypothetical protein LBJ23_09420 [Tannerella sp.]|jgi:uncharacterized membrane protein|nr:hypothetical protein [Tannerella sp.]